MFVCQQKTLSCPQRNNTRRSLPLLTASSHDFSPLAPEMTPDLNIQLDQASTSSRRSVVASPRRAPGKGTAAVSSYIPSRPVPCFRRTSRCNLSCLIHSY